MTDHTQPEALRLAEAWRARQKREADRQNSAYDVYGMCNTPETVDPLGAQMAAELRRQQSRIAELEAQLESIGAGGVNGPLMTPVAANAGSEPVAAEESRLYGDAKLAHDQCRAVVHLAHMLAEVYQANALILAAGQGPVEIIGQASAEVMEILGDIINSTDAMDEDDLWLDPIYDAAQARWPAERAAAPRPC